MKTHNDLNEFTCPICGVVFIIRKRFIEYKRKTDLAIYCPAGHHLDLTLDINTAISQVEKKMKRKGIIR